MIEFKIKGHVLRLTRAEWDNIKARFNPEKAVYKKGVGHRIGVRCKLCSKYRIKETCSLCPFSVFASSSSGDGCLALIREFFPSQAFFVDKSKVYWYQKANRDTRRQLNSIQKRMKKIEDSQ